jgi:hypothetical protein
MSTNISVGSLVASIRQLSKPDWLVARYCIKIMHPGEGSTTISSKEDQTFVDGWHLTADELPDDGIAVLCYTSDDYTIAYFNSEDGTWRDVQTVQEVDAPKWWTDLPWAPE